MAEQWSSSCVPCVKDDSTLAEATVEYEHHEIHDGNHYVINAVVDLAINEVFDIQLATPDTTTWLHLVFRLQCESETAWHLYENVTIATAGAAVTPVNNNRNSANTSAATVGTITNASTVAADADTDPAAATLLASGIVGAGRNSGEDGRERELILKQNTAYSLRIVASAAGYTNYALQWYEHTNQT